MIKKFLEFNESVKWSVKTNDDEIKIYSFKIENHNIDVIITVIEDDRVKFDFMVDGSYNKSINLTNNSVPLFTTLRDILNDYVTKHRPNLITFMPYDKDQSIIEKKEKINSLIKIPGYNKKKIGISTIFIRNNYQE